MPSASAAEPSRRHLGPYQLFRKHLHLLQGQCRSRSQRPLRLTAAMRHLGPTRIVALYVGRARSLWTTTLANARLAAATATHWIGAAKALGKNTATLAKSLMTSHATRRSPPATPFASVAGRSRRCLIRRQLRQHHHLAALHGSTTQSQIAMQTSVVPQCLVKIQSSASSLPRVARPVARWIAGVSACLSPTMLTCTIVGCARS